MITKHVSSCQWTLCCYPIHTSFSTLCLQVCSMLFVLGGVGLAVAMWYPRQQVLILLCNLWMGAFGLSQYTLSLEVAAEATFPVPESITTGVLIITSQLLSALLILFLQAVAPAITEPNSWFTPTCGEQATPRVSGRPGRSALVLLCSCLLRDLGFPAIKLL